VCGKTRKCIQYLVGKHHEKRQLRRPRHQEEGIIKMDLKETDDINLNPTEINQDVKTSNLTCIEIAQNRFK
jgi:hypothetical protein